MHLQFIVALLHKIVNIYSSVIVREMIRLHHCLGGISAVNLITSLVTAIIKLTLLELKLQLQNSLRSSDYCNYKTHFTRAITAIIKLTSLEL